MQKKKPIYLKLRFWVSAIIFGLFILASIEPSHEKKDLSGGYFYSYGYCGVFDAIWDDGGPYGIYSKILDYDYDSDFIIVVQQPIYQEYASILRMDIDLGGYHTTSTDSIVDSILKHDSYYRKVFARPINYWIISHKAKRTFGPFSKEEYLQKRVELNVPNSLQLDR